jgi:sugar lactone lactonase YvrE
LTCTLCPTASWDPNGITVAGGDEYANTEKGLTGPCDVEFDQNGNLYIADAIGSRLVKYFKTPAGKIQIMTNQTTLNVDAITRTSNMMYFNGYPMVNGRYKQQLQRLNLITDKLEVITSNITDEITGLYAGAAGSIYISTAGRVLNYTAGFITDVTAPVTNSEFCDVFVDEKHNDVYVVDSGNDRIQKWTQGAKVGITVAGGNGNGAKLNQLNMPQYMAVDIAGGFIYVSDSSNDRIVRWSLTSETQTGELVVGGGTTNATSLKFPEGIAFDKDYNLYVADYSNNRVQKFLFNTTSCPTTHD